MTTERFQRGGALLLALSLFCAAFAATGADAAKKKRPSRKAKIAALRQRLKTISHKKAVMQAELRQTKRDQRRLSTQLNDSYEQLEQAQSALKVSQARLQKAEAEVREATQRLRVAEEKLALQRRRFGRRVAMSYKEGPVTYADVFLGSRSISDFLDRKYYVSRVMGHDAELLEGLRRLQEEVARQRQALVDRKAALAEAHQDNADKVGRVARQAEQRERLLQAVRKERALQEQQILELEEDSNDIQADLDAEMRRRLATPGGRNLGRWTGRLGRPTRGRITSRFGYRMHPVLRYRRLHAGVDFGGGHGAPVYAAADGEVFFASWRGGYGRCIIVLHGGGMATLYGHLSRIDVRRGQSVRRGQRIGAIGSTGLSTGPHLHFELRRNGVPVNPL